MNILLSPQGDVLGWTRTADDARRHEIMLRMPVNLVLCKGDIRELSATNVSYLMDRFGTRSVSALWQKLRKAKGVPRWGKVSVKEVLRYLYTEDPGLELTEEELMDGIPGASWISIVTAISMLKNKKYADGSLLVIEHKDGKYRRKDGHD